ncbi:MAG: hypothetical protein NVSMB44_31800 [Ktedonobacteraceae bacterium]
MAEVTYDGNEMHPDPDRDAASTQGTGRQRVQAPPTLFPNVLHQLGLSTGPAITERPVETAVDDVVLNLQSYDWQMRIAAVRTLGKLGEHIPVELLEGALEDEDSSVRAAAVAVLGNAGTRTSVPHLVQALHDGDWHVRETAILALSNWRQDVPTAELNQALYDVDGSVRQAARLALDFDAEEDKTLAPYGRLWEQKNMSQRQEPYVQQDEQHDLFYNRYGQDYGTGAHAEHAYALHEQAQAYAPHETVREAEQEMSYEYNAPTSVHAEKVTNLPPRRSHRGWWAIIAGTALVFFLLGSATTRMMEGFGGPRGLPFHGNKSIEMPRMDEDFGPGSRYALMIQNEVSRALNTNPDAIRAQLKEGRHLNDIAAAQGVSEDNLHKIELQALTNATNAAFKGNGEQSDKVLEQARENPQTADSIVSSAFLFTR